MENLYEIHLTIPHTEDIEGFKSICKTLGVKPIVLDLDSKMVDYMTSSTFSGTESEVYDHTVKLKSQLKNSGYEVIRTKIETTLLNPIADVCTESNYYETHIAVNMNVSEKDSLKEALKYTDAHVSNNMFKTDVQMITIRSYEGNKGDHINMVDLILEGLDDKFKIDKVIHEYCIYDSNVNHDAAWLEK